MSWGGPLLARLRADPAAEITDEAVREPDAKRVVTVLEQAVANHASEDAWRALDDVAQSHDPEVLDEVLARIVRRGPFALVGRSRRRRLLDVARRALAQTERPGTLRLAAALLGALGKDEDVEALETIAAHPAFTLHGATALAGRGSHAAIGALLRLLSRTGGDERVVVIDRLLAFIRQPAVRLALLRDAFVGLDDDLTREFAPVMVEELDVAGVARDADAPHELRESAQRLLRLAGRAVPPHDLVG